MEKSGVRDPRTRHAGCPVLIGEKWGRYWNNWANIDSPRYNFTVTSRERHCVSNHRQPDCMHNSWFRLITKEAQTCPSMVLCEPVIPWRESIGVIALAAACCALLFSIKSLQWRHNEHNVILNQQPHDCLLNRLFRRRSKKISKLRVTGLCEGNSPVTGEFPAQKASSAENVSIWWRHHVNAFHRAFSHLPIMTQSNGTSTQRTHDAIMTSVLRQNDVVLT